MRYIEKTHDSQAKKLLDEAKTWMQEQGLNILYQNFTKKKELNDILRKEQKGICCYCQRTISHYSSPHEDGSHNEHFEPESGPQGRTDLQLEYTNLYACCNASRGFQKQLQHCGEYKGCNTIGRNFLCMSDCSEYFKYNTNGEILPLCPMSDYKEICDNRDALTDIQKEALQMIETLNLNANGLKEFRKRVQTDLFIYSVDKSWQQIEHKILILNTAPTQYIQLIDMVLFFLKRIAAKKKEKGLSR